MAELETNETEESVVFQGAKLPKKEEVISSPTNFSLLLRSLSRSLTVVFNCGAQSLVS